MNDEFTTTTTTTPSVSSDPLSAGGVVLRTQDGVPTALRLAADTMLVRSDLPAELTNVRNTLEQLLVMQGLHLLDRGSVLAGLAATKLVDLPAASWDLWGNDLGTALAAVAAAAQATGSAAAAPAAGPAVTAPAPAASEPRASAAPVVPPPASPAPALPADATAPSGVVGADATEASSAGSPPAAPGTGGSVGDQQVGTAAVVDLTKSAAGAQTRSLRPPSAVPVYRRTAFRAMAAATAVVVAVLVVLFVVVLPSSDSAQNVAAPPSPTPAASASAGSSNAPIGNFVEYHDPQGRFSLSYPASWQKLTPPTGAALVLGDGGNDGLVVRVFPPLGENITSKNIANVRDITDTIVESGSVKILAKGSVTVNGMPAYYYLYTFTDQQSGQQGANSHYFVFSGARMLSLVFQTLPDSNFGKLSSTFDKIVKSLHVTPVAPNKNLAATPAPTAGPSKAG